MNMKNRSNCVVLFILLTTLLLLTACSMSSTEDVVQPDHTFEITVANSDETTITYANEEISLTSDVIYITNNSEYEAEVVLIGQDDETDSEGGISVVVGAGETASVGNLKQDSPYQVGCRVSAEEGTEIELVFSENAN